LKISCIEEIAYRRGFMNDEQMQRYIGSLKDGHYKKYLQKIYEEYHETKYTTAV
jgi:glucose-1-phosphate thymidylyltransferase